MSDSAFPPILNELPTNAKPPTYFRTNKFTKGFQALVNAYGVANYREVNPGLYTTISFPFLFAVMFGDAGHALFVVLFAAWMCWNEEKLAKIKDEVILASVLGQVDQVIVTTALWHFRCLASYSVVVILFS